MLEGLEKRAISGPEKRAARQSRAIATIGAAYTGATPFRQCGEAVAFPSLETAHFARIIQYCRCITGCGNGPVGGACSP